MTIIRKSGKLEWSKFERKETVLSGTLVQWGMLYLPANGCLAIGTLSRHFDNVAKKHTTERCCQENFIAASLEICEKVENFEERAFEVWNKCQECENAFAAKSRR